MPIVARLVGEREIQSAPAAEAGTKKQWVALQHIGACHEKDVRAWDKARKGAIGIGAKAHVGRVFGICVEKGPELPPSGAGRTCKGGVVFQGSNVKHEETTKRCSMTMRARRRR